MITRKKHYVKRSPSRDARKIYVFCEGKGTEPDYFFFFEGLSSNLQIMVIPPEDGTDPLKLMDLAKRLLLDKNSRLQIEYNVKDSVWFVIDTDTWEKEGKISKLREFCFEMNKSMQNGFDEVKPYDAWNVTQSNPSFEIWLFYHFYEEKPDAEEVEKYNTFKEFVNSSIRGGFDFQQDPVRLRKAILNARDVFFRAPDGSLAQYSTEVYLLGEEILPFVKRDLERLERMMK